MKRKRDTNEIVEKSQKTIPLQPGDRILFLHVTSPNGKLICNEGIVSKISVHHFYISLHKNQLTEDKKIESKIEELKINKSKEDHFELLRIFRPISSSNNNREGLYSGFDELDLWLNLNDEIEIVYCGQNINSSLTNKMEEKKFELPKIQGFIRAIKENEALFQDRKNEYFEWIPRNSLRFEHFIKKHKEELEWNFQFKKTKSF